MLEVARLHASTNTKFVCGQASALPLAGAKVDIAVAARSLCHEPDLVGAFRELARITRSGGICIVSDVHAEHAYPRTRIPFGSEDVHIETFKRMPQEIMDIATGSAAWGIEHQYEVRWKDLTWKPEDDRFVRIDRASHRPIFYIIGLRRR
jgi:SAM-dependent methyltransferase